MLSSVFGRETCLCVCGKNRPKRRLVGEIGLYYNLLDIER